MIGKPNLDLILCPPKSTLIKSVFNPNARAAQFYNVVKLCISRISNKDRLLESTLGWAQNQVEIRFLECKWTIRRRQRITSRRSCLERRILILPLCRLVIWLTMSSQANNFRGHHSDFFHRIWGSLRRHMIYQLLLTWKGVGKHCWCRVI